MQIRVALPADAEALAALAERCFRDTFGADNRPEDMDQHCAESYGAALQAREIADPGLYTLVVEADQRLIAFAQLRWAAPPACVQGQRPGEVLRFYVDRPAHGRGVAAQLMHACLREFAARGSDVVWLGVWERNPRAIAFYRKFGFEPVGDQVFVVGSDPQRDLVLQRPLTQPA